MNNPITAIIVVLLVIAAVLSLRFMTHNQRHYSCAPFPFEHGGAVCDANGNPVLRRGIK